MRDLPGLGLADEEPGRRTWLAPELLAHGRRLPDRGDAGVSVVVGAGRGILLRWTAPAGGPWLIRTYRRGGVLRGWLPDVFGSDRRARAEVRAGARLAVADLGPVVVGLEVEGRAWKRLRIAVREDVGARDVLRWAGEEPAVLDDRLLARELGRVVAGMHAAGVSHRDLNAANLLARRDAGAWRARVIDLDGARLHDGPVPEALRVREVLRLCRSIDKWTATAGVPAISRAAFLAVALPRPWRRRVWRAARWRARVRAWLGRRPR